MELGVLGPLHVRQYGLPVAIPGAKPRALLCMLGLHGGSVVPADTLVELLWGDDPPRTAAKALQTHISALRRTLGDGFVVTEGTGWRLSATEIDATRYLAATKLGRDAMTAGDTVEAVIRFDEALALWRGTPELPEGRRGASERTRWVEGHAALVEDRAEALLTTGRAAEIIGELEAAIADAPLRERRWGHLMLALYRAGRQGEALGAYQRARSLLADELGVDPGPDLRRLESAIVAQDVSLEISASQRDSVVTRAVTFLLTDIEGSTAAWEKDAGAMAVALARHDEMVEQVVTFRGGRLIKTRGEGDATFSVFDRPSAAAAAAIELQEAVRHEAWVLAEPMRIRVVLHTGEVEFRDGDYFGRAVNRAARLRSLAAGGQILCSGATAELVVDTLADDVVLTDLGLRQLKNLARAERVFELRLRTNDDDTGDPAAGPPIERPVLPAALAGPGPFVGRGSELERMLATWQTTLASGTRAVLVAGEPGVGKTRLAAEWSSRAHAQGAVVLYGRCDEDLGAPYQPFAEALRSLVPCLGIDRLRRLRGVESLLPLVPGLIDVLPEIAAPTRADADTERYALFDAVVGLLAAVSTEAPVVLVLDDLHWAAKPTLLLLRHVLRFGEHGRVHIVGTYRSTDLDRSHPLAAMLADLHRDGSADRITLGGLDEGDVTAYVAEAGYDDDELARALATVTGGNPFFLIEALRHVDESGGRWDPSTLPQGVREAVSRRLSRLPAQANKALAAAAVVGSRFALDLVERVLGDDLVDAFDEAAKAGLLIEEPGGHYRFNHALVRQSLLAELASVRRMRLHQKIAVTLETEPGADDELLADLAHHYFECAWAGNADKAVDYCRRAADQAMARLAYEGAADLYGRALHALEDLDDPLPDQQQAELLIARCEALLAAGDVVTASNAVAHLRDSAGDSGRLAAWGTCFDGQLSMLTDPERLEEIEVELTSAAAKLAQLADAAGEAMAHTVRAGCLGRLGRVGACEAALDQALTAARRARDHRRVNAVLAGAPLAALWGPNPVPRAGGRCLDVVRLLRITTGSPVVEATSTRCQGVLDAFRGRASAGRQLIESARRSLTELGMRHALLEVDQFAGIVELVAGEPASAEVCLRRAYQGFRRMGLDSDTAETAALLAKACLELDRDAEADELCAESERLAGHALKASIAWRTVRAQLCSRAGDHDAARRVAEEAVAIAERTDALVDHGDACLALATVLAAAGSAAEARAAAERAVGLYEAKGAAALVAKARDLLDVDMATPVPALSSESTGEESANRCVRALRRLEEAHDREDWDGFGRAYAPDVIVEIRRKIIGFTQEDLPSSDWPQQVRRFLEVGGSYRVREVIAIRGEQLALVRLECRTTDTSPGAPLDESLLLAGLDEEERIALQVAFDVEDIDAALAELDAQGARSETPVRRPHRGNAASLAGDRIIALFADNRWDELADVFAAELRVEDRRRGLRRESNDPATEVDNLRQLAELGVTQIVMTPCALRGERLCLSQVTFRGDDVRSGSFATETLAVDEVDEDGKIIAMIAFDPDGLDDALRELDARYLAGEAAPHARVWSVTVDAYSAFNRRELAAMTPDCVSIDHRRGAAFESGEMAAYLSAAWDDSPGTRIQIEEVHRLSVFGVVVTHSSTGTSRDGFEAEWRDVNLMTMDGELVGRSELFNESDLDAALARFDALSRPAASLENAASRAYQRMQAYFRTRDWSAIGMMLADGITNDDRRHTTNAGLQQGRDAIISEISSIADVGIDTWTSRVVATRGEHLVLNWAGASTGESSDAFRFDVLDIIQTDVDDRISARIVFDEDDIDGAFQELDARYLAGEAAPLANTWSAVTAAVEALKRREVPELTPDCVTVDHRRGIGFAPGGLTAYMGATLDDFPDFSIYLEEVHRITNSGAVVTFTSSAASHEGFDAEWRMIQLATVEGDLISRLELFDEADLDAALERFDTLNRPAAQLENAASRAHQRFNMSYLAGDWEALRSTMAQDFVADDRRRLVGLAAQAGREAVIEHARVTAEIGVTNSTSTVVATRGQRLALIRARFWGSDERPDAFQSEVLHMVEIRAEQQISAFVAFDLDDIDAAYMELDTRYLAGEAAPHAKAYSAIAGAFAAVNRHELPVTAADLVSIDHRRPIAFAPGDLMSYLQATLNDTPDIRIRIDAVHRLNSTGAVTTHVWHNTSQQGFDAEWRVIGVSTLDGDLINRCELFDESDLVAALARFDGLTASSPRLENAATRTRTRVLDAYNRRDIDGCIAFAQGHYEDHRRGLRDEGTADREYALALLSETPASWNLMVDPVAVRGDRLALTRETARDLQQPGSPVTVEFLTLTEITADDTILYTAFFDIDDIDAAYEELDARYLAGEGAFHANTWSAIVKANAAFNSREMPPTTPGWVNVDHRRGGMAFAPGDQSAYIRATWDVAAHVTNRIVDVHRLSDRGAAFTQLVSATSHDGFNGEWRDAVILTVDGDMLDRCEAFDEADLDSALARFDELNSAAADLQNTATRVRTRVADAFNSRDRTTFLGLAAPDGRYEDRRKGLRDEATSTGLAKVAHTLFDVVPADWLLEVKPLSIRGSRLALTHDTYRTTDGEPTVTAEHLTLTETGDDRLVRLTILFDVDEIELATAELDALQSAGEAASSPGAV
ncbi:BTAD domain-containing putative transcriptional regulator [Mycobacterium sp. NPDC050041]|uniref:BTAD domain-containing putative transcriptional regulator n=1 Tax=Mycobacterium sp. NPDC050041 TaxID=3364293 RepID=UPI003C2E2D21